MAFTSTYSFTPIFPTTQVPTLIDGTGTALGATNDDTVGLRGGGWATAVTDVSGHSDVSFYDTKGAVITTFNDPSFYVHGALAQLKSGNVVSVGDTGGLVQAKILTSTGTFVSTPFTTPAASGIEELNADVAAINNGGFVVVDQRNYPNLNGDNDIAVYIRDANGAAVSSLTIDFSDAVDTNPCVTGLTNGSFAVAWNRADREGNTAIYYAVYASNGNVRVGPTLLDGSGSINREPSIAALKDGGFAISYEDDQYDGEQSDITVMLVNQDGTLRGRVQAESQPDQTNQASVTTLSNGLVLTTFTNDYNGTGDLDILATLVDASGDGAPLSNPTDPLQIDFSLDSTAMSSVSALNFARFAVSYSDKTTNVAEVATFQLQRNALGTGQADTFVGDEAVNVVNGLGGNDMLTGGINADNLNGGANDDMLYGLAGNDVLTGGLGNDTIDGGAGNDTASYSASTVAVAVDLRRSTAQDTGGAGIDTLVSIENLVGGRGADTLFGNDAANRISGGDGNDRIAGFGGADTLTGGAGANTFIYTSVNDSLATARDKITDFVAGTDKINLALIDANTSENDNQAFTFIGTDKFSGVAGQLNFFSTGGNTYVQDDVNGDKVKDFQIQLTGNIALTANDFVL